MPRRARPGGRGGGLTVIGTERHESRRIDNQLRGRAGRQGVSGETQFYLSLEDDLMRMFGGEAMDKISNLMVATEMGDDQPIQHKMISKAVEGAQRKVEQSQLLHAQERARVRRRHEQAAPGHLRRAQ